MRDRHAFTWQSLEILIVFNTLTLTNFLKSANPFQKTGASVLVESIKIENATFPYKTALSEANGKTNRMGSINWTYHKERSFASNCFIFTKILFQFKNLVKRVDLMYQPSKCPHSYFLKALEFYLRVLFSCEYPYKYGKKNACLFNT